MRYIDADRLRAEIERRKKGYMNVDLQRSIGRYYEDRDLLAFLDSIEQEQPSLPDLDEAAEEHINKALFKWSYDDEDGIEQYVYDAFIAGAEWAMQHKV